MMRRIVLIVVLSIASSFAHADTDPTLLVSSSGSHLWIAVPTSDGCRIMHHAADMNGPFCRQVVTLPALPTALASHANQLLIIMPPSGIPAVSAVYSLVTDRNPATGTFYYQPAGRLEVLPSIQSAQRIVDAVSTATGPRALIPNQNQLIKAEALAWSPLELPADWAGNLRIVPWFDAGDESAWALLSQQGADLVTWNVSSPKNAALLLGDLTASERPLWSKSSWIGAADGFVMVITGSHRPAVLSHGADGSFSIGYPTSTGLRKLGPITPPSGAWSVIGLGEQFQIVWIDAASAIHLMGIDALNGAVSGEEQLIAQPTTTGDWIHLPFIGALTIGMLLAGFIIRPPMQAPLPMPVGWQALSMGRRITALTIDMIPGAIVALLLTGASLEELSIMPSWTPELSRAVPASIMLGFTGIWCAIFEIAMRASPGKFIVGGRVVRAPDGGTEMRAGKSRSCVRAVLKTIVLFAPALGFLSFVHPLQQGLPETLSKTVVARRI